MHQHNTQPESLKEIAVLGSTGSIGTQTLDIIREFPERFHAHTLTAGRNVDLLIAQAKEFRPRRAVIADEGAYGKLRDALRGLGIETACGAGAIAECVTDPDIDYVVTAMVGYSGLLPTVKAIGAGKRICLANKETLVVAGELITGLLAQSRSSIVPVDSEHSAIFQSLVGEDRARMRKIILTASGGPFRKLSLEQLRHVTVSDALHHPNWEMGAKVTIDSASMMNKGFEMIEARWLFDTPPEKIEIVVHPQSIVHSMVEYVDGSVKAQLGLPDMHLPISYALGYPDRLPSRKPGLSVKDYANLTFEAPDMERFPMLGFAFDAIRRGGNMPCILNAANEIAVDAFLRERIGFMQIPELVADTMAKAQFIPSCSLDVLVESNRDARHIAETLLGQMASAK